MPYSRPEIADLLVVVREFMETELLPDLEGDRRFHCRVAINLLATIGRELELRPELEEGEAERLAALLGRDGDLAELEKQLARLIRDGLAGAEDAGLIDHLRATTQNALRINNPKWLKQ